MESNRRNILVAVAGQTPAIVTETLWTLEQQKGTSIDEIRVITTSKGKETIVSALLGEKGAFTRYCKDYRIPQGKIGFSEKSIFVLRDAHGRELSDIRTNEDNIQAADQVFSLIRGWTAIRDEILFCSVAGGRKTLGIYLSMALMLCGRQEDSLTHVLVAPELESGSPHFFYPSPDPPHQIQLPVSGALASFSDHAGQPPLVELADIPFPRLREVIGGDLPLEKGLTEAVSYSQLILSYLQSPPTLNLTLTEGTVTLGSLIFQLSKQLIAVYAFFLLEFNTPKGASMEELFLKRLRLAALERTIDRNKQGEKELYAWEKMKDPEDFAARIRPCISKINRAIDKAFGRNRLSDRYRITSGGNYGVDVKGFTIQESQGKLLESPP